MKKVFVALLAASLFAGKTLAGGGAAAPKLVTDPASVADLSDRRLGFMIHWGPCTEIPTEISWGMGDRAKYEAHYKTFNPKSFDAGAWADVATTLGARYSVLVAKHHDGFCLWDTKTTPANIMNTPLHRDVVAEYMKAFREHGLRAGTYVSIIDVMRQDSRGVSDKVLPPGGVSDIFEYTAAQVDELMKNYGSDLLWFDGHWLKDWTPAVASKLYARIKANNPRAISCRLMVMPRDEHGHEVWDNTVSVGDFHSMEARSGEYLPDTWEAVTSVAYPNYSWSKNLRMKTPEELIAMLSKVTCGNGNLLLNFIPDSDGRIDDRQIAIARTIGGWVKANGDALFGVRAGPWYPGDWGGATYKGKTVYLQIGVTAPEKLRLPACEARVLSATTMSGASLAFEQNSAGELTVTVPRELRTLDVGVVRLTLDREPAGMVASREEPSLFTDPAYGKVLSKNATFTLSSTAPYDLAADHAKLFDGAGSARGFAFHTEPEKTPSVTVDLGKMKALTGIAIVNRAGYGGRIGKLRIELSADGQKWTVAKTGLVSRPRWEVPFTDFHDHTETIQGERARYIRLTAENKRPEPLHLARFDVYGFEL